MILDLTGLDNYPAVLELHAEAGAIAAEYESLLEIGAVTATITVNKTEEEYFCQGKVKASVKLECARCLKEFETDVEKAVDFIACVEDSRREAKQQPLDDEDYVFLKGIAIQADISVIVRQAIVLSLSLMPVCSEDCRGLCPQCGVNFNERGCDCNNDQVDERWDALKEISGRMNNQARG